MYCTLQYTSYEIIDQGYFVRCVLDHVLRGETELNMGNTHRLGEVLVMVLSNEGNEVYSKAA